MRTDHIADLMAFLADSPTSFHAVEQVADRLSSAGHEELDVTQAWQQLPTMGFVQRDGAIIAWCQPAEWTSDTGLRIAAAHTDSPALKLKPAGGFARSGFKLAEVEIYGGPILHTWFDRDLAVAGRLVDREGATHLVRTRAFVRVPQLAIHLDREINSELSINAQRDLNAAFGMGAACDPGELEALVAAEAGLEPDDVLGHDLVLVPAEPPALLGVTEELLASYRLDNLLSVHSCLVGYLAAENTADVQVYVAFDHEEIGSGTPTGASGPLLSHVLRRLSLAQGFDEDAHLAWLARGFALSADVGHGVHPNRPDRHDPQITPQLNAGPVLKWSAPMRYTTDGLTWAQWTRACELAEVPNQVFVNNNTVRGGSSLGPLLATRLGVRTVDAGIPVVSMHSARELCGAHDPAWFAQLTTAFLSLT